jgi:hypothetical protein
MKLFAVYVGGDTKGSNIELHDMRFCIAETIEDCHAELKEQWWGTPESLHLDCWGAVESADQYEVSLRLEPYTGEDKLFFVNLGGYDSKQFTELHKNIFVAAPNDSKAKVQALKTILDWESHHRDYLFEVEKMVCLNEMVRERGLHIHLTPTANPKPFEFTCKYLPIGKAA